MLGGRIRPSHQQEAVPRNPLWPQFSPIGTAPPCTDPSLRVQKSGLFCSILHLLLPALPFPPGGEAVLLLLCFNTNLRLKGFFFLLLQSKPKSLPACPLLLPCYQVGLAGLLMELVWPCWCNTCVYPGPQGARIKLPPPATLQVREAQTKWTVGCEARVPCYPISNCAGIHISLCCRFGSPGPTPYPRHHPNNSCSPGEPNQWGSSRQQSMIWGAGGRLRAAFLPCMALAKPQAVTQFPHPPQRWQVTRMLRWVLELLLLQEERKGLEKPPEDTETNFSEPDPPVPPQVFHPSAQQRGELPAETLALQAVRVPVEGL